MSDTKKGVWIPLELLTAKDLTASEKILIADILPYQSYWKTNASIATLLCVTQNRASIIVNKLIKKGILSSKSDKGSDGITIKRVLTVKQTELKKYLSTPCVLTNTPLCVDEYPPMRKEIAPLCVDEYPPMRKEIAPLCVDEYPPIRKEIAPLCVDEYPPIRKEIPPLCVDEYHNNTIDKTIDKTVEDATGVDDFHQVAKAYSDNIHPLGSQMEMEHLKALTDDFGKDTVIKAIEIAVMRNNKSLGYIKGILNRWETHGFDDGKPKPKQAGFSEAALEFMRKRDERKKNKC